MDSFLGLPAEPAKKMHQKNEDFAKKKFYYILIRSQIQGQTSMAKFYSNFIQIELG